MGLSASKRVSRNFGDSMVFNSACDSVYEECLSLTQHAFPGVRPYQLSSATDRLHHSLSATHPLVRNWIHTPPSRSQVDKAYRIIASRLTAGQPADEEEDPSLGPADFQAFAVEVFTDSVLSNAGKTILQRVPIGVAGIAGIGIVTQSRKDVIGTAIGAYAAGVAASIYLSLAG